jgi:hypothetical protein
MNITPPTDEEIDALYLATQGQRGKDELRAHVIEQRTLAWRAANPEQAAEEDRLQALADAKTASDAAAAADAKLLTDQQAAAAADDKARQAKAKAAKEAPAPV